MRGVFWQWVLACAFTMIIITFGLEATIYGSLKNGIHIWCVLVAAVIVVPLEVYVLNELEKEHTDE